MKRRLTPEERRLWARVARTMDDTRPGRDADPEPPWEFRRRSRGQNGSGGNGRRKLDGASATRSPTALPTVLEASCR